MSASGVILFDMKNFHNSNMKFKLILQDDMSA